MVKLTGPAPKPADQRVRRHKDLLTPGMEIKYDGVCRGPELDPSGDWCEKTLAWWEVWRYSPQAQLMTDTDWEAMQDAAYIHNQIWYSPGGWKPAELVLMMKQLHQILSDYGMSYGARLKLRIKIADDKPSDPSTSVPGLPDNVVEMYRRVV